MKSQRNVTANRVREPAAASYGRLARSVSAADVLLHVDRRLHAPASGNLDARRIAARLGISAKRLALAVGYTPQGLSKNPTSDKLQPALAEIAYVLNQPALTARRRPIGLDLAAGAAPRPRRGDAALFHPFRSDGRCGGAAPSG